MIRKCFNEEVKASNKSWKVSGSAVCFLYNIFFLCILIIKVNTVLVYCFLWEKVGHSEKSRLLGGSEKNRRLNGVENGPADYVTCAVGNAHCLPKHKFRVLLVTDQ